MLQESRQVLSIQKELEHHKELTLEFRIKKKVRINLKVQLGDCTAKG